VNRPYFNAKRRQEKALQIETVGEELRKMMPWVKRR
jgi:ketol-acid reductoisomerase